MRSEGEIREEIKFCKIAMTMEQEWKKRELEKNGYERLPLIQASERMVKFWNERVQLLQWVLGEKTPEEKFVMRSSIGDQQTYLLG